MPLAATKYENAVFRTKVKVKVIDLGCHLKGHHIKWIFHAKYEVSTCISLDFYGSKVVAKVKQTERAKTICCRSFDKGVLYEVNFVFNIQFEFQFKGILMIKVFL